MLQIDHLVYYLFLLILAGLTNFPPDRIYKNSELAYTVVKKDLKLISFDKS